MRLTGVSGAMDAVNKYEHGAEDGVRDAVQRSLVSMHGEARRGVSVDRAGLRDSIHWETEERGFAGAVIADAGHALYVEFGTRAHTAPLSVIVEWAERQGLGAEAGRAIWAHIRKHGTAAHPFLQPAADLERPRFAKRVADALRRVVR